MHKGYKYRIYPTDEQKEMFAKTFGCCRFVYNWALKEKIDAYKKDKTNLKIFLLTNRMKSELKEQYDWLKEVNSQSLQTSLQFLGKSYSNFFDNPHKVGFPKFKSRKNEQKFHNLQNCKIDWKNSLLSIPKVKDIPIKLHRKFSGVIKDVAISMTPSGKYFASVLVNTSVEEIPVTPIRKETTVGIDLGIKSLAVCSDGRTFGNNKHLKRSLDRLAFLQKSLSRKKKGSSNRNKARIKIARLQETIANRRKDILHKITHTLTHDSQVKTICIEDLNVKGMTKNHHLAQSVNDASFGMFATMLEYKCEWYGINLIKIDRFAPSSKTCSKCGNIYKELKLSERSWTCQNCGTQHDRDLNAAINIKEFGLKTLSSERGKVKSAETSTMDDRAMHLKSSMPKKQKKIG